MLIYIYKLKYFIVLQISTSLISIMGIASMPYILKKLLDYDYSQGIRGAILICISYLSAVLIGMIFEYFSQKTIWKIRTKFHMLLKQDLFDSLLSKDYYEFHKSDTSNYISIFANDIDVCCSYVESIISIIQTFLQLFVYAFFLIKLNFRLAFLIILCSFLSLLVPKFTGHRLSATKKSHLLSVEEYLNKLQDLLSGYRTFNNETRSSISKQHHVELFLTEEKKYSFGKRKTLTNVITGSSMYGLQIIVFFIIAIMLCQKHISIGTASAAMGYIQDFCYPVSYILKDINNLNASRAGKDRIANLLNTPTQQHCGINRFTKAITFKNVTKSYGNFSLNNFNYTFEKGKKYAIIGPSGTGKSTILNLLMQYILPDSGEILIDGVSINGLDTSKIMMCINQNEHTFSSSVVDNVSIFGTYSIEKIKQALKLINNSKITELIQYNNASDLSGGEKQMVHFLKSIVADKEIILMDEPFSGVDKENTQFLQNILLSFDKTIIIVTHDLNNDNLKNYDDIISMN